MKAPSNLPVFWVTNASPRNVTLADLALNIKAYTTVNLLDSRHYSLTLEQLIKSKTSGSLFKKRDKIIVRKIAPPPQIKTAIPFQQDALIPSRERSAVQIKQENFDELKISDDKIAQKQMDEQYADQNAELVDNEMRAPETIAIKKK